MYELPNRGPDRYYRCSSCRAETHEYHVVNFMSGGTWVRYCGINCLRTDPDYKRKEAQRMRLYQQELEERYDLAGGRMKYQAQQRESAARDQGLQSWLE